MRIWAFLSVFVPLSWTALATGDGETFDRAVQKLGLQRYASLGHGNVSRCDIAVSKAGDSAYHLEESHYWANQQRDVEPLCRVTPTSAVDVSKTVIVARLTQCQFAVKSGGHAAFAGASNIQGGITIDLKMLNEVTYDGSSSTRIGPGNQWGDVYSKLDPQGVTVIGGRVFGIGVGGLTLGGGISFFSGHHGWACDGVSNYQVVLADGQVVDVNLESNRDLYYALRGGGNNFGIVTRFDLITFKQGRMWGGMKSYPPTANASLFKAFENFSNDAPKDPSAALILSAAYTQGQYVFVGDFEYDQPISDPPIFDEFKAIQNTSSTMRITTMTDLARELNNSNPGGFRQTYTTATFKNSASLQSDIFSIYQSHVDATNDVQGYVAALTMQPITKAQARYFGINGGNALGISVEDCPLLLVNLAFQWSSTADDSRVLDATTSIIREAVDTARAAGLSYKYLYQNYASAGQEVFAGYGPANQRRLQQVSTKYDPNQVFQKLQPGYFKLFT